MGRHRVVGGVVVTTPDGVFAHYRPSVGRVDPGVWQVVQPVAVRACRAADYVSVASALAAMSTTTHFLAWAHLHDIPLDLETVFTPSRVERYCATQLQGRSSQSRSTARGFLRRVGRACTRRAPWAPDPKPFASNVVLMPPYSPAEVEGFRRAAQSQANDRRSRVATVMLVLGLGAGLKPGEMLHVSAGENVRFHPRDRRLAVIVLDERTVPVLASYVEDLRALCRRHPEGPLIGPHKRTAKDPLGAMRCGVAWPDWLPAFRPSRLRTTWMATVLSQDLRISEFMVIAGTVSSKSLECVAPFVTGRWDDDAYLFKGAGL